MRAIALTALALFAVAALAAPKFPKLTGPVVDDAHMLSAGARQKLAAMVLGHQNATGDQVVVVTLPNLQGYTIEEYGYRLGRYWGLGQKGKDNGAMLIVAKAERKIRIEVGYGLEGGLTDAISSNIISTIITPEFKKADFDDGVIDGTRAIIAALGGQYEMRPPNKAHGTRVSSLWSILMLVVFFWVLPSMFGGRGIGRGLFWGFLLGNMLGGGGGRYRGGGGFGGGGFGGFSGGGGSFGGGGASGGW